MTETPLAPANSWLTEPLSPAVAESVTRLRASAGVEQIALMPDIHLSHDVCIGVVVATDGVIYPQAVGGDIGCGMAALAWDVDASVLDNRRAAGQILAALYAQVPSNKHRRAQPLPSSLDPQDLSDARLAKIAARDGAVQLGTLGRGNHFLEFQADQEDRLWVMLHGGSRAMGQAIAARHLGAQPCNDAGLIFLDATSEEGVAYLVDVAWAREYAATNRLAMLREVESLIARLFGASADWDSLIHSDHNHVQRENHGKKDLFVHRKGAQSAGRDEPGVIPGSMGAVSFHTVGRGCEEALRSCSHGAGRQMSRSEARRRVSRKAFQQQVGRLWFDQRRTDKLRDESPAAYKDIRQVMRAQRKLLRTVRELRPLLSYKGS